MSRAGWLHWEEEARQVDILVEIERQIGKWFFRRKKHFHPKNSWWDDEISGVKAWWYFEGKDEDIYIYIDILVRKERDREREIDIDIEIERDRGKKWEKKEKIEIYIEGDIYIYRDRDKERERDREIERKIERKR